MASSGYCLHLRNALRNLFCSKTELPADCGSGQRIQYHVDPRKGHLHLKLCICHMNNGFRTKQAFIYHICRVYRIFLRHAKTDNLVVPRLLYRCQHIILTV